MLTDWWLPHIGLITREEEDDERGMEGENLRCEDRAHRVSNCFVEVFVFPESCI